MKYFYDEFIFLNKSLHFRQNPPVVLLDEATSALDTVTEASIQEALGTLSRNRTVVVIAHRLSTIKHADQIVVLDQGGVAEVGGHEELLGKQDGLYARLWNMQLRSERETAMTILDSVEKEEDAEELHKMLLKSS